MPNSPRLDPDWIRRRQPPVEDNSLRYVAIAVAILIASTLWIKHSNLERETRVREAAARVEAANLAALRQAYAEEARRAVAEAMAARQDRTGATSGAWVQQAAEQTSPTQQALEDQRLRQAAEARLREEQARFAQLTGQGQAPWQPGVATVTNSNQARCARAKADRDNSYRIVGNNRTFDFIRQWDGIVYEACKNT